MLKRIFSVLLGLGFLVNIGATTGDSVPQIHGSIVDTDTQYTLDRYDEILTMDKMTQRLTGWKNDKVLSQIALVSKGSQLEEVTLEVGELVGSAGSFSADNVKATFVRSVKAYNGPYPGYGSPTRAIPRDNGKNRFESSDILWTTEPVQIGFNRVQPVWVEIRIPKEAQAGTYTTTISVTAKNIATPLVFTYTVEVQDATLPDAQEFKTGFDIELWQYPYSVAEYYGVEPFSDEHFELLRPSMEFYKSFGGTAITASILEDAWGGQIYSANEIHYPSMIKWIMVGGKMTYDYTHFDKWVQFNKDLGIGDKIILYSIAPWHDRITYWKNGKLIRRPFRITRKSDQRRWKHFLNDLIVHLNEKGWFEESYIGVDERGFSTAAFDLIDEVKNPVCGQSLKKAGAMDNFVDKRSLALRMEELSIGDSAIPGREEAFAQLVADREAKGWRTTLYSCTKHQPGQFSLSAPAESYWVIANSGKQGVQGFLRWAYDAWVEDPLNDTTHNSFESGDCFLVYPDEKDAENPTVRSSIRLEKITEGVRDINKLLIIEKETPSLLPEIKKLYDLIKIEPIYKIGYLSDAAIAQVIAETTAFKDGINNLTEEYIKIKGE